MPSCAKSDRILVFLFCLLRSLRHRENRRWLVSGIRRQMGDARMEIESYSLSAHADDDTVGFGIPGDQLGLSGFFLDGHYFRCFGHDTEYADCSARTPVAKSEVVSTTFTTIT